MWVGLATRNYFHEEKPPLHRRWNDYLNSTTIIQSHQYYEFTVRNLLLPIHGHGITQWGWRVASMGYRIKIRGENWLLWEVGTQLAREHPTLGCSHGLPAAALEHPDICRWQGRRNPHTDGTATCPLPLHPVFIKSSRTKGIQFPSEAPLAVLEWLSPPSPSKGQPPPYNHVILCMGHWYYRVNTIPRLTGGLTAGSHCVEKEFLWL